MHAQYQDSFLFAQKSLYDSIISASTTLVSRPRTSTTASSSPLAPSAAASARSSSACSSAASARCALISSKSRALSDCAVCSLALSCDCCAARGGRRWAAATVSGGSRCGLRSGGSVRYRALADRGSRGREREELVDSRDRRRLAVLGFVSPPRRVAEQALELVELRHHAAPRHDEVEFFL